jgi:hypothetical protein
LSTDDLTWWINGVCQLLLSLCGFLSNCVSVSILTRKEMSNTFNRLLSCLAISDNFHLLCTIAMAIMTIKKQVPNNWVERFFFCFFLMIGSYMLSGGWDRK